MRFLKVLFRRDHSKPKLRWYQFSLRTLLVFVTLCALPCSWLAVKMERARKQREAVEAIEKLGGRVVVVNRNVWHARLLLSKLMGNESILHIDGVKLNDTAVNDTFLDQIAMLPDLHLLSLNNTLVTDVGLRHLDGLTNLKWLYLNNTKVTDAGLEPLKGFTQLHELHVAGTKVTDEGIRKLQQALPNCVINH